MLEICSSIFIVTSLFIARKKKGFFFEVIKKFAISKYVSSCCVFLYHIIVEYHYRVLLVRAYSYKNGKHELFFTYPYWYSTVIRYNTSIHNKWIRTLRNIISYKKINGESKSSDHVITHLFHPIRSIAIYGFPSNPVLKRSIVTSSWRY